MDTEAKKTDAESEIEKAWHIVCKHTNGIRSSEFIGAMLKIVKCVSNYDIELRDAKIAAARRGAELARDDVYRIKEPTLETGGLSEVEYKHSIDEVLDVYTKELDGDE